MYNIRKFISFLLVMILVMTQSIPSYAGGYYVSDEPPSSLEHISAENDNEVISYLDEESEEDNQLTDNTSDNNQLTDTASDNYCNTDWLEEQNTTTLHPDRYNLGSNYTLNDVNQLNHDSLRYKLTIYSLQYLGNPYVWGGTSLTEGADCSGFTQSIFNQFHIKIPRTAAEQYNKSKHIVLEQIKPGDLIFYGNLEDGINHVAIYIGDNQIIHASSSKTGIIISNLDYKKPYGYGSYIEAEDDLLQLENGYYVSGVIGNYYNGVRASAYTIGLGSSNNIGMGLCCNHGASTASVRAPLTQANNPAELESYGYDRETQFRLAILCSLAPYANGGTLNNPYINWSAFGCSTPSQANALCSLACSYICGHNYGGVSQAVQLANWVIQHSHEYWDFWGNIQNTALSNTSQDNLNTIVTQNGIRYYMTKPMQLTGNESGSTFKISTTSVNMQAVISNTDSLSAIKNSFVNNHSTSDTKLYSNAKQAVIDKNQYITLFYPIAFDTIGKPVTATMIPSKSGAIYRLNYYFPAGGYQPVVMCDGTTTVKSFSLSFTTTTLREIIIKKQSKQNSITMNNPNYSLKGAAYNIYNEDGTIAYYFASSDGKLSKAENLKTDENGNIIVSYDQKKTTSIHVLPGIYYVKETKASPGYLLDSCSSQKSPGHRVDVRTKNLATVTCLEPPVSDSISLGIYKKDVEPGELSRQADLSGAIFKVCFYNKIYRRYSDITEKPTKTWFIETKKNSVNNYVAKLDPYHLSSKYKSSDFYKDSQGNVTLPLGTLTITEFKPPKNYHNVNFHGRFYDGVNHVYDVTNTRQGTFFGTIRTDTNNNACLYIGSSMNTLTDVPTYGNLSMTYSDRIIPTLKTRAFIDETGCNIASSINDVTCYDSISMKGLAKGKTYTITSKLVDKDTGEVVKDTKGMDCIHTQKFTASKTEDTCKVYVGNISGKMFSGKRLVIQEFLQWDNRTITSETDLSNSDQTIYFPTIKTKALTGGDTRYASLIDTIQITDSITYQNLIPGKNYTFKGTIMYTDSNNMPKPLLDHNGNPCTTTKTFIPEQESGTIDIYFTIDALSFPLNGLKTVIFEDLFYQDCKIATHSDIHDENQTIYFPDAKTSLICDETQMQNMIIGKHINLTDKVSYSNLELGSEHVIKGQLMNKYTGEAITDANGKPVTAEVKFIPEKTQGVINVSYSFDIKESEADQISTKSQAIVCFENIYRVRDGKHIICHENINDIQQTVFRPIIKTTAWEQSTRSNRVAVKDELTIIDTIAYSGLIKGESYTVKGILMLKNETEPSDSSPFIMNEQPVTGETSFTADNSNGTVDVYYTLNATDLEGKSTVVFEDLYYNNYKLATHRDINCEEQTIHFTPYKDADITIHALNHIQEGGSSGSGSVKTGDNTWIHFLMLLCLMFVCLFFSMIYLIMNRKDNISVKNHKFSIKDIILTKRLFIIFMVMVFVLFSNTNSYASNRNYSINKASANSNTQIAKTQITKSYSNLKEKNDDLIQQTIEENHVQYQLKSITWKEEPIKENIDYTIDYGYCTTKPEYSDTFVYTYTSPTTNETVSVTLPFVQLNESDALWRDGFSAIATFNNIENGVYTLGNHTFTYSEDMILSDDDYQELIHLLGYDASLYRFQSYEWNSDIYTGSDGTMCRDAILFGQQYATKYSAYYADTIQIGTQYHATAIYEPASTPEQTTNNNTITDSLTKKQQQNSYNMNQSVNQALEQDNQAEHNDISVNREISETKAESDLINQITAKKRIKYITNSICIVIIFICLLGLIQTAKKNKKSTKTVNEI